MHYDPEHVEAYFLKGDPTLDKRAKIDGDVIWLRTDEGWIKGGSAGIINKTILALEKLEPRFDEFDYILRTNLSSFYVFPRLLDFLQTLPPTNCYAGRPTGHGSSIGSGAGLIISPDVATKLVESKRLFLNNKSKQDDVLIGNYINKFLGLRLIEECPRVDILAIETWHQIKNVLPDSFHFRVKNNLDHWRATDEVFIYTELVKRFYPYVV